MPRRRFLQIKKFLHFADNEKLNKNDKLAKIRPLVSVINVSLKQFGIFNKYLSIDEQMIPYYGKHSAKMYIKNKPIKFGYKAWVLAGSDGYPYHMDIYFGKSGRISNLPLGQEVIQSMLQYLADPRAHVITFDNFFSSYDTFMMLREAGFILVLWSQKIPVVPKL